MQPPSLGARVLARFLDGLVVAVIVAVVAGLLDVDDGARVVTSAVVAVAYETAAIAVWRRTAGKAVCRFVVVADGGGDASAAAAATRAVVVLVPLHLLPARVDTVGEWLVLLFVLANAVVVAVRREDRRGIHDLAAGTRPVAAS